MSNNDLFSIEGRVAIVTGASSGLGDRFTRVLHDAGAHVVTAARRVDRLEALAGELGDPVVPVQCDISNDADCERLVATTIERFGRVDILVNNAGIGEPFPAEEETLEYWRSVIDINLTGQFVVAQQAGRKMLEQASGTIINIASILGMVAAAPIPQASYCASKGALINLTRELACQWARKGIRVNSISPGWFVSEMTEEGMFGTDEGRRYLRRNCPMGRGGDAHELDGALLFLASDASSYVTGANLPVDGGWTAR